VTSSRRHQKGYIFKKGNGWFLRYYDSTFGADGRTTRRAKCKKLADCGGQYRSKTSVKPLAEEFLRPFNEGRYTLNSGMTVRDFVEQHYLPSTKNQKRPSTYDGYRKMWRTHLQDRMVMALRDFRTVDCEKLLNQIANTRHLGVRTIAHIKHLLSGIFRYAIRTGYLNGTNPIRDAVLPTAKPAGDTYAYTLDEISKMIELLPASVKTIVAVAAFTGLRRGELRGLEVQDYTPGSLMVRQSIWKKTVGAPKGKRGIGAVPVIPWLGHILDAYIEVRGPKKYLFETIHGAPSDLDYLVQSEILPALEGHSLSWHGWHAFRRGLATNLHQLGVVDIVIQAILRHSDVAVTRESYIKRDGIDPRSMAAMQALETHMCNHYATEGTDSGDQTVVQ
jgi:integrase